MRRRRYPSDTTNAEWALTEPLLPTPACEPSNGDRPEKHPRREIVDAVRYAVATGCKWRGPSADFPPHAGKLVDWAKRHLNLTIRPVSRPKGASGFVVLPRRWVVERSLAWMMHARRHARDYQRLIQHTETHGKGPARAGPFPWPV